MMGWIHSAIDYVNNYWQVHQYDIMSVLGNSTFWLAVCALALVSSARTNRKLLRHFRRQSWKHKYWEHKHHNHHG